VRERAAGDDSGAVADPAAVDLLGLLAYAELTAFERLADDARFAPTLEDRAALGGMAVAEFGHFRLLHARLTALGVNSDAAMAPFVPALDAFHESTAPGDWLEGLIKAYVGDGIAADFYREVASYLDESTRDLVIEVLADTGHAALTVDRVQAAIAAEPALAGRLALWARRLVGETLTSAQRVTADREALARLIARGRPDPVTFGRMMGRLTDAHSQRMASLGLSA